MSWAIAGKMALKAGEKFIWGINNDILEIRLMTSDYQTYFKGSAPINNKTKLRQLLKELEDKGIIFNKQWFD